MEYGEFGRSGVKVSRVGMGTYYDPLWILIAALFRVRRSARRRVEALRAGLDAGMNLIDTAEIYQSEPLVREAIRGRRRDELFIASKVWRSHLRYDAVLKACEGSLRRLGTSYLDLYQVHFPNRRVPIRETMAALERLVEEGKVRHIGVSNFSLQQTVEAQSALSKHELVSTQMHYNLARRDIERDLLSYCEREKIAVLAYYPLGHGKLAKGKTRAGEALREVAKRHGKTPAQVALNWLLGRSEVVFPIPRASNPAHVRENAGAAGWRLNAPDMERLNALFGESPR